MQKQGVFFLISSLRLPKDEWSAAEARGGRDGRQKGSERGYYDLHLKLNDVFLFHSLNF